MEAEAAAAAAAFEAEAAEDAAAAALEADALDAITAARDAESDASAAAFPVDENGREVNVGDLVEAALDPVFRELVPVLNGSNAVPVGREVNAVSLPPLRIADIKGPDPRPADWIFAKTICRSA